MKTPIVWTAPASANLEEIRGYASGPSSFFGDNQVDAIVDAISTLADFPEMGRLGRRTGTRELVIHGTPYIVAYRIRSSTVRILAIVHGARRWPRNFAG